LADPCITGTLRLCEVQTEILDEYMEDFYT